MQPSVSLLATIKASIEDAQILVAKRLPLVGLTALLTMVAAVYVAYRFQTYAAAPWIAFIGTTIVSFAYYGDTLRRVFQPAYQLSVSRVFGLLTLAAIVYAPSIMALSLVAVADRYFGISANAAYWGRAAAALLFVYFGAKWYFAPIALKDYGVWAACRYSWSISRGQSFWATFLIAVVFLAVPNVTNYILWAYRLAPVPWSAIKVAVDYGFITVGPAFGYPFAARLLAAAEASVIGPEL